VILAILHLRDEIVFGDDYSIYKKDKRKEKESAKRTGEPPFGKAG
jgi:hypothetical protein